MNGTGNHRITSPFIHQQVTAAPSPHPDMIDSTSSLNLHQKDHMTTNDAELLFKTFWEQTKIKSRLIATVTADHRVEPEWVFKLSAHVRLLRAKKRNESQTSY